MGSLARRQESRGGGDYVAKEVDHGGILGNLASRVQLHPCILPGRA
jgi:hypothetical protein